MKKPPTGSIRVCHSEDVGIKVSVPLTVTDEQKEALSHMLGVNERTSKSSWGYRNRFCATVGSKDESHLEAMAKLGLVVRGQLINDDRQMMFYATEAGCRAIGLSNAAIKRALED